MSLRVGFIGLGNQGKPIASHLAPSGFETTVFDVVEAPMLELAADGAKAAKSPAEVGANAEVVGICVPEDKHVLDVVLGEDGLLSGLSEGAVILIHSTVLPETAARVEEAAAEKNVAVLDACVTGGEARARVKQITYLIGGPAEAIEKARPYFEATSELDLIHAGELGNGAKLKLCVNLMTYIQWGAAYESIHLAMASGLAPEVLEAAGASNGQITPMMQQYIQGVKLPQEVKENEDYQALMRNHTAIAEKDLAWVLQLARQNGLALPFGGLASQSMARLYNVIDEKKR